MQTPIYLDNSATTPLDPAVVDAMLPWLREQFGNPASSTHAFGHAASKAVEAARAEVARLVGAEARDIAWTSGATESNNLAIKGLTEGRVIGVHVLRNIHGLACWYIDSRIALQDARFPFAPPPHADAYRHMERLAAAQQRKFA